MGCSPRWPRFVCYKSGLHALEARELPDVRIINACPFRQVVPSVSISYVVYEHSKRKCIHRCFISAKLLTLGSVGLVYEVDYSSNPYIYRRCLLVSYYCCVQFKFRLKIEIPYMYYQVYGYDPMKSSYRKCTTIGRTRGRDMY